MRLPLRPHAALLGSLHGVLAPQAFSGYAGDCLDPGFAASLGWDTAATAFNCGPHSGAFPPVKVRLSLDNCLSFDGGGLVGGLGGGYVSQTNCSRCVGNGPCDYACVCHDVQTPSISLNDLIGVNSTNGSICCNAGTDEAPAVRCS